MAFTVADVTNNHQRKNGDKASKNMRREGPTWQENGQGYFISDISGQSQQEWIPTFIFTNQNAEGDWATSKPGCKWMQQGAYGIPLGFFHQWWGFELSSGQISPNESMRPNTGTPWLLQIVRFQGSKFGNLTSNLKNVFCFCLSKYLNLLTSKPQLQIS